MPKKATSARSGAQRTKPKNQKSFELVRPVTQVQEIETDETNDTDDTTVEELETTNIEPASPVVPAEKPKYAPIARRTVPKSTKASSITREVETDEDVAPSVVPAPAASASKGSASARLAARKNVQRTQRNQASLITAEHYSYVRRDLVFIAVLAAIMFAIIIILYFVPAIGGA